MDEPNMIALIAGLGAPAPEERSLAAEALSQLGAEARPAAVALVRASGDEAEEVREWAVAALEELGPPLPDALPELMNLLRNSSADIGYWAATLIGRLEQEAAPAVSELLAALQNAKASQVRQRVAWALGQIGPPATLAVAALREATTGDDARLARLAQEAIEQIGGS